jgi:hypothetical protein
VLAPASFGYMDRMIFLTIWSDVIALLICPPSAGSAFTRFVKR